MVDFIFTFVVPAKISFFNYELLFDITCRDLKNRYDIDFFYSDKINNKYRIMMMNCTRKKAEEVCDILEGVHIRELDPFTVQCFMEIIYGILN